MINYFDRMLSIMRVTVLFLAILSISSCTLETLKGKRDNSPTCRIGYWGEKWHSSDLKERIRECPPELVERIRIENEIDGYKERPVPVRPTPEIISALQSIESSMPHNIRDILRQRLIGVFTVKELGGTGYTDVVYDRDSRHTHGGLLERTPLQGQGGIHEEMVRECVSSSGRGKGLFFCSEKPVKGPGKRC